ncbi:MAG: DUF2218 domain-containing protein [Pseudonocardiales bacterium]|nr:DUF2218 domain-containing protein [Pseudonocardiales bacterium]
MLSVEAQIRTDRASRYLIQLCRHVSRIPAHHGGRGQARRDVQPRVEWSDTFGIITLVPWAQCAMHATPDTLTVHVEATDEDHLQRVQDLVAERLTTFGRARSPTGALAPAYGAHC